MPSSVRPYRVSHVDGRRHRVVAKTPAEAVRHVAEHGWSADVESSMDLATQTVAVEYARPEYRPMPAGTPDSLDMPGEKRAA